MEKQILKKEGNLSGQRAGDIFKESGMIRAAARWIKQFSNLSEQGSLETPRFNLVY